MKPDVASSFFLHLIRKQRFVDGVIFGLGLMFFYLQLCVFTVCSLKSAFTFLLSNLSVNIYLNIYLYLETF